MVFRAVDGLHYQAVRARLQVIHLHLQSDGNHGISLLNVIIRAHDVSEKYLLVSRALENSIAHGNNRRGCRGQQRLIDLRVKNDVVRMLEAIASRRNDLRALDHQGRAVFQQNRIQAGGNVVQPLRGIRQRHTTEAEMFSIIGIDGERRLEFRSEEHTSELQSRGQLVCRLLLEKKKQVED